MARRPDGNVPRTAPITGRFRPSTKLHLERIAEADDSTPTRTLERLIEAEYSSRPELAKADS